MTGAQFPPLESFTDTKINVKVLRIIKWKELFLKNLWEGSLCCDKILSMCYFLYALYMYFESFVI